MARSKAWQAEQWRVEIGGLTGVRHKTQLNWDESTSQPMVTRLGRSNTSRSALISSEFTLPGLSLTPTLHAQQRMAQRNLSAAEIEYVLLYGQSWHKAGAVIIHLRRKDLPTSDQLDPRLQRLIGTTVVITTSEQVMLTAYRNRCSGLRQIKRKPDYDRMTGRGSRK